jgi:hypothetical protein
MQPETLTPWLCQECNHVFADGEQFSSRRDGLRCKSCDDANQRDKLHDALNNACRAIDDAFDADYNAGNEHQFMTLRETNMLAGASAILRTIQERLATDAAAEVIR